MSHAYLATGFRDVDGSSDAAPFQKVLAVIDALPYYGEVKRRSYELLDLSPGLSVLEVGCGLGDDVLRMAERVSPGGKVVGVDASARMVEAACARDRGSLDVEFHVADARRLPFGDGTFSRCRVDRTLQHIEGADKAIAEMVRVLEPGGLLLAYDNDWGTFSVSGSDKGTTERLQSAWINALANPWLGRYLPRWFQQAGLSEIVVVPSVSVLHDLPVVEQLYNVSQTAARLVDSGDWTRADADAWLADLDRQSHEGTFICSLTAFTVVGRKPAA